MPLFCSRGQSDQAFAGPTIPSATSEAKRACEASTQKVPSRTSGGWQERQAGCPVAGAQVLQTMGQTRHPPCPRKQPSAQEVQELLSSAIPFLQAVQEECDQEKQLGTLVWLLTRTAISRMPAQSLRKEMVSVAELTLWLNWKDCRSAISRAGVPHSLVREAPCGAPMVRLIAFLSPSTLARQPLRSSAAWSIRNSVKQRQSVVCEGSFSKTLLSEDPATPIDTPPTREQYPQVVTVLPPVSEDSQELLAKLCSEPSTVFEQFVRHPRREREASTANAISELQEMHCGCPLTSLQVLHSTGQARQMPSGAAWQKPSLQLAHWLLVRAASRPRQERHSWLVGPKHFPHCWLQLPKQSSKALRAMLALLMPEARTYTSTELSAEANFSLPWKTSQARQLLLQATGLLEELKDLTVVQMVWPAEVKTVRRSVGEGGAEPTAATMALNLTCRQMCSEGREKERVKVLPMVGSNSICVKAEAVCTEQLSGESESASPLAVGLRQVTGACVREGLLLGRCLQCTCY